MQDFSNNSAKNKEIISFQAPANSGVIAIYDKNLKVEKPQNISCKTKNGYCFSFIKEGKNKAIEIAVRAVKQKITLIVGKVEGSVYNAVGTYAKHTTYVSDENDLERAILDTGAEVIIVSSSDCFGNASNIKRFKEISFKHNAVLLVDATKSSNFAICDKICVSATDYGDIVIYNSIYKNKFCVGGAFIFYHEQYKDDIKIATLQSSCDIIDDNETIKKHNEFLDLISCLQTNYEKTFDRILDFKKSLKEPFYASVGDDIGIITLSSVYNGIEVYEELAKSGIVADFCIGNRVVFCIDESNVEKLDLLAKTINNLKLSLFSVYSPIEFRRFREKITPLAFSSDVELVDLDSAVGRVSASVLMTYPTCIPDVLPGEIIGGTDVLEIKNNLNNYFGLVNNKVCVVKCNNKKIEDKKMKGVFITFEGCEGVGKSTQLKLLKEYLEKTGQDAVYTREPGGTEVAEQIRGIILNPKNKVEPMVEAYLFATARADHVKNFIKPNIEKGKIVICDRYLDSSLAYQGVARGLGLDNVWEINRYAVEDCLPDCTIFIDLPPKDSWRRKNGKEILDDRMELESIEFHNKVYEGFCQLKKAKRFASIVPDEDRYKTSQKIIDELKSRGLIK